MKVASCLPLLALCLGLAQAITIPVDSMRERCMVVFSTAPEDFLKIDIKFSRFQDQGENDYYAVTLLNTETHETQNFQVKEGTFRRQIQLSQTVLYKLCMKIIINRFGSSEAQQNVEYYTRVGSMLDADKVDIVVPDSLLKVDDLRESYRALGKIQRQFAKIKTFSETTKTTQDEIFTEQESKIKDIEWISVIEFVGICILGLYQFFRLRALIENKQKE